MTQPLMLGLVILTAILVVAALATPPDLISQRSLRLLLFVVMFIAPVGTTVGGLAYSVNASSQTSFCISCHEMHNHGKSLQIDDSEVLAAVHVQNRTVPTDRSCYTCHTDYAMFGDFKAKLNGIKHLWVHYLGEIPEKLELYQPYSNANCLHCHDQARSFLEAKGHGGERAPFDDLRSGTVSCLTSGCHDVGHAIDDLADADFWPSSGDNG